MRISLQRNVDLNKAACLIYSIPSWGILNKVILRAFDMYRMPSKFLWWGWQVSTPSSMCLYQLASASPSHRWLDICWNKTVNSSQGNSEHCSPRKTQESPICDSRKSTTSCHSFTFYPSVTWFFFKPESSKTCFTGPKVFLNRSALSSSKRARVKVSEKSTPS